MRVNTITCHDVYNVGAALQAYALCRYLRERGHDAHIIDYKPDYLSGHYRLWGGVSPRFDRPGLRLAFNLAKFPGRAAARMGRRKRNFDSFRRTYLPLTARYDSFAALCAEPPPADVYLAGSDQIWNTLFPNGRDPAFYLQFAPAGVTRASYAASFAMDAVDPAWAERQRAWIGALDYVSVREPSGLALLEQLGITGGEAVMDPVFLLPAAAWRELVVPVRRSQPYLLVYDFDGSPAIRAAAEQLAAAHGCEIVTVLKLPYGTPDAADAGPDGFLGWLAGAEYVLSNSFHATAFSLILHRPFMTYGRQEKLNSRMRDLMEIAGLSGRKRADEPADWDSMDERLKLRIAASEAYLSRVLHES